MNVVHVGNHSPGVASTESYVATAIESLGHTVIRHQENGTEWATLAKRVEADDCPLVFWTRTPSFGCDADHQRAFVEECRALGIVTCGLHLDRYWDLERELEITTHPWWRQDHVYTADGGNQNRFEAVGVAHRWWRPAVSATQCGRGVADEQYASPLAFVGSIRYHSEWPWRRVMLKHLERTYGDRFAQYGRSGQRLEDHQLADAYASVAIIVGDSCFADRPQGLYWCVDEETEILTGAGWKRYDQVSTSDEAYTINPETGLGEWQPVEAVTVQPAEPRTLWAMEGQRHSSLTTLNHRWLIERHATQTRPAHRRLLCPECGWASTSSDPSRAVSIHRRHLHGIPAGERRYLTTERRPMFVTSADLQQSDRIPLCAPAAMLPTEPKWSDAFVELVAWAWTEGSREHRAGYYSAISQSHRANPGYVARIRAALTALCGPPRERLNPRQAALPAWAEYRARNDLTLFSLSKALGSMLWDAAPGGIVTPGFVRSLTRAQLQLFVETSIDADGCRKESTAKGKTYSSTTIAQKEPERLDPVEMACALLGIATNRTWQNDIWLLHLKRRSYTSPLRKGHAVTAQQVEHDGVVWCPTTANGTWLARRRGTVYFTGNSNRIAETLGRGGFLLHPRVAGIEDHYADGEHLGLYEVGDIRGLIAMIERWLPDDEGRRQISEAGMQRVIERDTFEVRMAEVLGDLYDDHPHLRPAELWLEPLVREGTTDRIVIREQFVDDTYRIKRADLRGRTVIDVGANIGAFSLHAAVERGAHVVAIEPEPGNLAVLRKAVEMSGADVEIHAAAVSGEFGFGHMDGSDGTAVFLFGDVEPGVVVRGVDAQPLDHWLADHDDVAVLKIDTEGAEYDIIEAATLLDRCERIEIEWHGAEMADGADGHRVGALVTKLLATHVVEVVGLPSVGGAVHAVRR